MVKSSNTSELAGLLMLTPQRVNQLAKEGIIKREADGKYDLPKAIEAFYIYKLKTDEELNFAQEHTLLERAKRKKAEIELDQLEGTLLIATEVEQAMATMILTCKSRLLAIPSRCAPQLIGQRDMSKIASILKDEIYQALNELKEMPAEKLGQDGGILDVF